MSCGSCGHENPTSARFCNGCGAALGSVAAETQCDPRDYTPEHLADEILQSKSALESERKQITVLFADVKGSMELAQQTGPEAWHQILERFLAILTEGVHRFERHGQPVHGRRHPLQAERLKHQAAARIDRPRSG